MSSTIRSFPLLDELDQYTQPLNKYQEEDLTKDFDEIVAMIEREEFMNNGAPYSFNTMPPMVLPPVSHTNRAATFDIALTDGTILKLIDECSQPDPNTDMEITYEPMIPYDHGFGNTQPCMYQTPAEPMVDFDLSVASSPTETAKPRGSKPPIDPWLIEDGTGKKRRPLLHEFLRRLVENEDYSHIAAYVNRKQGIFKIFDRKTAAALWQTVKGRNSDCGKFLRRFY